MHNASQRVRPVGACPLSRLVFRRITPLDAAHTATSAQRASGGGSVWRRDGAAALAPANVAGAPYARRAQERRDVQRPPCQLRQLDEHLPPRCDLHLARRRPLLEAARARRSGQQHKVPADTGRGARCPAPSRAYRRLSGNRPSRGPPPTPLHTPFAHGHRPSFLRPVPGAFCSGHPRFSRPTLCVCQVIDMVPEEDLSTKGGKGKGKGKGKGEGKGEGKGKGKGGGRGGDGGRGGGRASGRGGGRGYN
jgi:uncharacterized membrane protein YgcG